MAVLGALRDVDLGARGERLAARGPRRGGGAGPPGSETRALELAGGGDALAAAPDPRRGPRAARQLHRPGRRRGAAACRPASAGDRRQLHQAVLDRRQRAEDLRSRPSEWPQPAPRARDRRPRERDVTRRHVRSPGEPGGRAALFRRPRGAALVRARTGTRPAGALHCDRSGIPVGESGARRRLVRSRLRRAGAGRRQRGPQAVRKAIAQRSADDRGARAAAVAGLAPGDRSGANPVAFLSRRPRTGSAPGASGARGRRVDGGAGHGRRAPPPARTHRGGSADRSRGSAAPRRRCPISIASSRWRSARRPARSSPVRVRSWRARASSREPRSASWAIRPVQPSASRWLAGSPGSSAIVPSRRAWRNRWRISSNRGAISRAPSGCSRRPGRLSRRSATGAERRGWRSHSGSSLRSVANSRRRSELYESAGKTLAELGDRRGAAAAAANLGTIHYLQWDLSGAEARHEEALATFRQLEDRSRELVALANLGQIRRERGDFAGSDRLWQQALELARATGDKAGEGDALLGLGENRALQGDAVAAQRDLAAALALFDAGGAKPKAAAVRLVQARIERDSGQPARAFAKLIVLSQEFGARGEADEKVQADLEAARCLLAQRGKSAAAAQLVAEALGAAERRPRRLAASPRAAGLGGGRRRLRAARPRPQDAGGGSRRRRARGPPDRGARGAPRRARGRPCRRPRDLPRRSRAIRGRGTQSGLRRARPAGGAARLRRAAPAGAVKDHWSTVQGLTDRARDGRHHLLRPPSDPPQRRGHQ